MEVKCPNCKKAQMTKGRIAFPCRYCHTIIKDPRVIEAPSNRYVSLDEVIAIAKTSGVYNRMKDVLKLEFIEVNKDGTNESV